MEAVLLRTSCDACTVSKVKCSGGEQCKRCTSKGVACFYSPRKKRGPPKKRTRVKIALPEVVDMDAKGDPVSAMNALGVHEKRSWSVFFSLYKHFNTSCSRHWFNRQLNRMRNYLQQQNNADALKRLTAWMEALNIDMDEMVAGMQRCLLGIRKSALENAQREAQENAINNNDQSADGLLNSSGNQVPKLNITGELRELQMTDQSEVQNLVTESKDNASLPFLKITTELDSSTSMVAEVDVNDAFTELFGYSSFNIEAQLRVTGGGFLPWGGDVLSRLLTNESDLLAFVQVMAIKFNHLGAPRVVPTVREVPSCHKFKVTIAQDNDGSDDSDDDSDDTEAAQEIDSSEKQEEEQEEKRQRRKVLGKEKETKTVECLIKCVHREVIAMDRSYTEMFFTFNPLYNEYIQRPFVPMLSLKREETIKRKLDEMLPNFPLTAAAVLPPQQEISTVKRQHRQDGQQQQQQTSLESSYMSTMDDPFEFGITGDYADVDLDMITVLGGAIEQDEDGVSAASEAKEKTLWNSYSIASSPDGGGEELKGGGEGASEDNKSNVMGGGGAVLPYADTSDESEAASSMDENDIDGAWLDSLLDWVKASE